MEHEFSILQLQMERAALAEKRIAVLDAIVRDQARTIDGLRRSIHRKTDTTVDISDQLDRAMEILSVFRDHLPGYLTAATGYVDAIRGGTNPQMPYFFGPAQPGTGGGSTPLP